MTNKQMSEWAKRNKSVRPFKADPDLARKAGSKGAAKRWEGHVPKEKKSTDTVAEAQSQPEA